MEELEKLRIFVKEERRRAINAFDVNFHANNVELTDINRGEMSALNSVMYKLNCLLNIENE